MNLRCPRCGAPVEPEDTFCGECGCPLRDPGNMGAPGYDDLPEEGPGRGKHTGLIIFLVVLIVAVKLLFFRDNDAAPIKNLVKVMEEGDAEAALELIPEKYLDVAESWSGMDREDMEEMVIEQIEDAFDDYSGDIEIDYEIGNARDMTESELEDLESSYMGFLGDIEEGKEVEFSYKLYVNGAKQEESDPGETVRVLKIDGKWYLDPEEL